jgi:two-component system, OmpR family, response regulator VanR
MGRNERKRGEAIVQETILVVDDDADINHLIDLHLSAEEFNVIQANNGIEAMHIMDSNDVHLVILDIMMPKVNGIEVCRRIREKSNIPIIMLSAKSTDVDKVIGLSTGADDYISKPFSPIELVARVRAQLRRYTYLNDSSSKREKVIRIKGLEIDESARSVMLYGKQVKLTKTEYEILILMARNPNKVFTLEELFEYVWKEKYYDGNNTVMVHIARLRGKIEENPHEATIIKNVWGVGYKIEN